MLWLAGLMGLTGVGVAALVLPQLGNDADTDDDDVYIDDYQSHGNDDLIQTLELASASPKDVEFDDYDVFDEDEDAPADAFDLGMPMLVLTPEMSVMSPADMSLDAFDDTDGLEAAPDLEEGLGALPLETWIDEGVPGEAIDYDPDQDSLVIVWDDITEDTNEPQINVVSDEHDPEVMHVLMNGQSVAEIYGDANFSVSDLTIIPLSSALIAGLAPGVSLAKKMKKAPLLN